jgi:hypothetical protein
MGKIALALVTILGVLALALLAQEPRAGRPSVGLSKRDLPALPRVDVAATMSLPDVVGEERTTVELFEADALHVVEPCNHMALSTELEALRKENARLRRELLRCEHRDDQPLAALLQLPEVKTLSDEDLRRLQILLEEWPVIFQPGEPTWLAERLRADDWQTFARTANEAIIAYLGPSRLLRELPEQKVVALREWYSEPGEWEAIFGRR